MLFQLLPGGFELPALFLLQRLSGMLKGIFEEAGSFFLFPFTAFADMFSPAKTGQSLPDLLPLGFQTLFLCHRCLPPVLS